MPTSSQARAKLKLCEELREAGVVGLEMVCGEPAAQQPQADGEGILFMLTLVEKTRVYILMDRY